MNWTNCWEGLFHRGQPAFRSVRVRRFRPALERLEERLPPAQDTLNTAVALSFAAGPVAQVAGTLTSANQVDLYAVPLNQGDQLTAAVNAQQQGSSLQATLSLFDGTGTELTPTTTGSNDGDPTLTFNVPALGSGTYYVGVSSSGGSSTGLYTLSVTDLLARFVNASPLNSGSQVLSGPLSPGQPQDYSVTVTGDTFLLATTVSLSGPGFEPRLTLYGGTGQLLIQSDQQKPGLASATLEQHLQPGTFFLEVSAAVSQAYQLTTVLTASLPPRAPLPVDAAPESVAVADLNGDGRPDIVTANNYLNTVSVLLGNGDGTFQPAQSYAVGSEPVAIAVADLGNGQADVVTANFYDNTVSVLLGNGDGTFQTAQPFAVGSEPEGLAVANLGNGRLDIITTNAGDNTVSVLLGNGTGTFSPDPFSSPGLPAGTFAVGSAPFGVALADLGNGHPDIVSANAGDNTVSVLLGNGDGTFQPAQSFAVGRDPQSVAVANLGNGHPDIVTGNNGDDTVSVLLGNGNGTFQPAQSFDVGGLPRAVAVADLTGDGIPDIITANYGDNTVSVLLGNGDGTFQPAQSFAVGSNPEGLAVADLNGDGRPDIVTGNVAGNTVSVLLGNGDGTFQPAQSLTVGGLPFGVAVADLGNGHADIITANSGDNTVSVLLNNGVGTFQPAQSFAVGSNPLAVVVADLNGDGHPDIVTANYGDNTVSVLLGNGSGIFQPAQSFAVGGEPEGVAVADLGNGRLDIVTANAGDNTVSVLLGNGDGTFSPDPSSSPGLSPGTFAVGSNPLAVVVADLNGDGYPDIVTANHGDDTVSVLPGNGDGTFQPAQSLSVGSNPDGVAVADLGNGFPDIVTANRGDNTVSVLLGNGAGIFAPAQSFAVGGLPYAVAVADLGNGSPDIVTVNNADDTVSVLLGNGNGTFKPEQVYAVGRSPYAALAVADLNGDGRPDIVTANFGDNTVSVLPGNGDGIFQPAQSLAAGFGPYALAAADLGNGQADLVTTNFGDNTVSVSLGNGDGTFQSAQSFPVGNGPAAVAVGDVNGDGRPDIVTANEVDNTVSVLLGNGDGSFQPAQSFAVGNEPDAVAVADLGNGQPAIITANSGDNTVSVLLGNGDGTFQPAMSFAVGSGPDAVAVADLGNGHADIVVANHGDDTVSVLLGNGNGTFQPAQSFAVGGDPVSVAVADLGNGHPDIVTANYGDNTVSVLLGNGAPPGGRPPAWKADAGTPAAAPFQPAQTLGVGSLPHSVAVADLGNGRPDIVTANYGDNTVSVLLGGGALGGSLPPNTPLGMFHAALSFPVASWPEAVAVADVNDDGRPDIVTANTGVNGAVSVLLNLGNLQFQAPSATSGIASRDVPQLQDLTGDGISDAVSLDQRTGQVLFRQGTGNANDPYAPFVVVNPAHPATDFTLVQTRTLPEIAALDPAEQQVFLYAWSSSARQFQQVGAFATGPQPVRIASADLDGNGLGDLVVANALDNTLTIALQLSAPMFNPIVPNLLDSPARFSSFTRNVGADPSSIAFADLNGDNLLDIVVSDQVSGDVSILFNDASHSFTSQERYRAGQDPFDVNSGPNGPTLVTQLQTVGTVAGDFTLSPAAGGGQGGGADVVALNANSDSFSLLRASGGGSLIDPQAADSYLVGPGAVQVLAGDFLHNGLQDLAILTTQQASSPSTQAGSSQVLVFLNNGDGTFSGPVVSAAGEGATGFAFVAGTAVPAQHAGVQPDRLLVGDAYGDFLTLLGDGSGRFQVDRGNLDGKPLAVGKTAGGQTFVVVADQSQDQVQVYFQNPAGAASGSSPFILSATLPSDPALLAPGAVQLVNLNESRAGNTLFPALGSGLSALDQNNTLDLVVASRLGNDVLVYPGLPGGGFGPALDFPVGFEPDAITVGNFTNEGVPDLAVANQGSNDVSILLGQIDSNGAWTGFSNGPRLSSGGSEPIAVQAGTFTGRPGILDLRVTNAGGQIATLAGIGSGGQGSGFFQDATPTLVNLPATILQAVFDPSTGTEFVVEQGGILATAGGTVLIDGGVASISVAGGILIAGLDNGGFELLDEQSGVSAVFAGSFGDEPSALQALRDANGVDVYATYQGQDAPVFYSFAIPVLTELPLTPAVAQASSLEESSATLVAVLVNGSLVEQLILVLPEAVPGEETFVLFLPASVGQGAVASGPRGGSNPNDLDPVDGVWASGAKPIPPGNPPGEAPVRALGLAVERALREQVHERKLANQIEDWLDTLQRMFEPFKELLQGPAEAPAKPTSQPRTDNPGATAASAETGEEAPLPPTEAVTGEARSEAENELFARVELLPARSGETWPAVWDEDRPGRFAPKDEG